MASIVVPSVSLFEPSIVNAALKGSFAGGASRLGVKLLEARIFPDCNESSSE